MKALIATTRVPKDFEAMCSAIRKCAEIVDCRIVSGIMWVPGSGCSNVAFEVKGDNAERFVDSLCMALMPAKWSLTTEDIPLIDTCTV